MNLLHLKYFYSVARTGSFGESARNLRVSQPAISKMVRQLEESIGNRLLERDRKGVRLTEAGETLFQSASLIFEEADRAEERIRAPQHHFSGEWTIGVSDNLAIYLMPKAVGQFKEKHPELRMGLFAGTSGQIKTELHYDRCQLGIFFTPIKANESFTSRQVHEVEFWVVVARKNRWFKPGRSAPTLAEVRRAGVPRLESRHSDYASGFPAHFHSRRLGVTERPWIEVNQHEVKKRLVLEGLGYAFLTRHTVEEDVKDGRLTRVECKHLPAPIYAVWRKGRELSRVSEAFLADWKKTL